MAFADSAAPVREGLYFGPQLGAIIATNSWDLSPGDRTTPLPDWGGIVGGRVGWHVLRQLAIEGEVAYLPLRSTGGDSAHALTYAGGARFFVLDRAFTPTLSAGFGGITSLGGTSGKDTDPRTFFGAGVAAAIRQDFAFRADVRDGLTDGLGDGPAQNLEVTVGLDFYLQKPPPPDADGDGVVDADDACPAVPGPRALAGCPDGDGDGVPDRTDRCPTVVGPADLKGCPDSDHDGVPDEDDRCVDVPAGAKPDPEKPGCPNDADHDGVLDAGDLCPQVPVGKIADPKRAGCPADQDGDSIPDETDACPTVAGVSSPDPTKNGCPADRDGDSVPDAVDACPDQPGAPSSDPKKNGCPGLVLRTADAITILQQVLFVRDGSTISPKSAPLIQAVADAVRSLPEGARVMVEGHTDNTGKADHNLKLSQERADAVRKALIAQGIDGARLDAKGFGADRPIASNDTAAGRTQNRRVEFKILGEKTSK